MGGLTLPTSGRVYVDTALIIYSVERNLTYEPLLQPLWDALDSQSIEVITSELTLLETLVKPLRDDDTSLVRDYEKFLTETRLQLHPINAAIVKGAARLRATTSLKTPDAIHAATALAAGCSQLLANDDSFRRIESPQVQILKDLL